jgi:glucan phosphoethanolaminetransferase (alkaline phosphatase superfamily)
VLAHAPASLVLVFVNESPTRPVQVLGYSMALWLTWVALWGRVFLACAAVAPLVLVVPVEIYLEIRYHTRLLPHVFGIIQESDWAEATEYLRGLGWQAALAYLSFVVAAGCALWILSRSGLAWRHRSRFWVVALFLGLLGGMHVLYQHQQAWVKDLQTKQDELQVHGAPLVIRSIRDSFPFGLFLRYADYRDALDKLSRVRARTTDFKFGARQSIPYQGRETFVLVIGESARVDRWSINGYWRATSPRLSAEPNLISLTDVVSAASATRLSVPVLLSRKPAERAADFTFSERSLVSAFEEAGYKTYWLSNQAPIGKYDTPISVYAKEADQRHYFNVADFSKATPYDDVMLPQLARILARDEPRQLIVIHTLGSHYNYRQRYPDQFNVYRPTPDPDASISLMDPSRKEEINNAYDNSILYSDYFLSEVITDLKTSPSQLSALLYVSDHGEDLFDEGCPNIGHGKATVAGLRVPVFFWYSNGYAGRFSDKIQALVANRSARLTTENIFPTLLDAAGISFPTQDLTRSAMSRSLQERRRLLGGLANTIDFDRARPNDKCELTN